MENTAVGIKNCKQLFSQLFASMIKKKARLTADIISAVRPAIFLSEVQAHVKKVVYTFWYQPGLAKVGDEGFHIVLRGGSLPTEHHHKNPRVWEK